MKPLKNMTSKQPSPLTKLPTEEREKNNGDIHLSQRPRERPASPPEGLYEKATDTTVAEVDPELANHPRERPTSPLEAQ